MLARSVPKLFQIKTLDHRCNLEITLNLIIRRCDGKKKVVSSVPKDRAELVKGSANQMRISHIVIRNYIFVFAYLVHVILTRSLGSR